MNNGPKPLRGRSLTVRAEMDNSRGASYGGKSDANFYKEMMVCDEIVVYFITIFAVCLL